MSIMTSATRLSKEVDHLRLRVLVDVVVSGEVRLVS